MDIQWPPEWQTEARDALLPYVDGDNRLEITVGDPSDTVSGSVVAGYVYLASTEPRVIYDRSGRADVYPWPLLAGPVLQICLLGPRRRREVLYAHPSWGPTGH